MPKSKSSSSRRTANLLSHVRPKSVASAAHAAGCARSKPKKESLYDLYNSEGDDVKECRGGVFRGGKAADAPDEQDAYIDEEFTVDMDVDILLMQTSQSVVRSVCLEDADRATTFGDAELLRFVSVLKSNTSILSLQIRYLNVSDISLVPLCRALQTHPTLRALDLSGTCGGRATSLALRELVCKNPNIVFVRVDNMYLDIRDAIVIEEGTQHNAMVCADPTNNPFHLCLLRKLSSIEEQAQKFDEELNAKPWLSALMRDSKATQQEANSSVFRKTKKAASHMSGVVDISADVCAQYMKGRCAYGSRCRYFHPERTVAAGPSSPLPQDKEQPQSQSSLSGQLSALSRVPVRLDMARLRAKRAQTASRVERDAAGCTASLNSSQAALQSPDETAHLHAHQLDGARDTRSLSNSIPIGHLSIYVLGGVAAACCATLAFSK